MSKDIKALLRLLGTLMMAEGAAMLSCLIPALHFHDGTWLPMLLSGLFTLIVGFLMRYAYSDYKVIRDRRMSYLLVVLIWVVLSLFGVLPFMATGAVGGFTDAFFESMSGLTSTGATILPDIEAMPSSILLWRSMTEWIGGFGIVLLVLAIVPSLGINKYSLYTAEASGADNTGKLTTAMGITVRHTLTIYVALTAGFIVILMCTGMHFWDAVNMTFTNISSGGFAIYNDSIASLTHVQQYILAAQMLFSGVNFAMLYLMFTLDWKKISHKWDQFRCYIGILVVASTFVVVSLHYKMGYCWDDAMRYGVVQTLSVVTTTGSVISDTTQWWVPLMFLFAILPMTGGMAGSTTGGLKVMRVLILLRNVKCILRNRLHPRSVSPVRLNGRPLSGEIITNVMVIFFVYIVVMFIGTLALQLCGINATESIGAMVGCLTSYGPGLGASGGFGSYAAFTGSAKWICAMAMLMGRLECMSVMMVMMPGFWRRQG